MEKNRSNNTGINSGSAGARRPVNNTGNANVRPANNTGNANVRPANNTGVRPLNNIGNTNSRPVNAKAGAGKKGNATGVVRTTTPRKARQIVKNQGMEPNVS